MRYEGRNAQAISFPIGGIGTGSIGIAGNGALIDWEIKNRPNKCSDNGFSFFAVKAEKDGKVLDARVLNGDRFTPYQGTPHMEGYSGYGFGPERCTMAGAPHFRKCVFDGSYPYAKLEFSDDDFPGKATVTAFNPMIPSDEDASGIPAGFFDISVENDTTEDLDYIIAGTLQNANAFGKNIKRQCGPFSVLFMEGTKEKEDDPGYGNVCLAVDSDDCSVQEYWFRGQWFDALGVFWQDFNMPGLIKARSYDSVEPEGRCEAGSITARVHVKAGQKKSVRFVIAWYYPNYHNYWNPMSAEEQTETLKNTWKNYYATRFESAQDAAVYALKHWDRLNRDTQKFHDTLFETTIPDFALDAVASTMSVLKTATCVRLTDGSFYGWEGLRSTTGSCEGTCTHVWNYAYALPFLFPRLERTLRETNYRYNQDEIGGMHFRTQLPLGRKFSKFRPCADGQFGDVMKTYREWKLCGNTEWLKALWPAVKKSVEYAWNASNPDRWDINKDGVLEGRQHHTLDMELFGPSGWLNGFYLGALKAASEMAAAVGDQAFSEETRRIYLKGREYVDGHVFNGEYYAQEVNLKDREQLKVYGTEAYDTYWNSEAEEVKYQIENGCSIDQVTAQWHANLIGLGDILDAVHVRSALEAIYKYNFTCMRKHFNPCRLYSINDERGTVMCAWPEGVKKPVIPIPYAEETMYGFEYEAAVSMMQNGMMEKGLELVKSIRERHNGENRNPWNEMECGSNYARSMASYSILIALSGFTFDMTQGCLGFRPIYRPNDFKTFWAVDGAWGSFGQTENEAEMCVKYGELKLRSFSAAGRRPSSVKVNEKEIDFDFIDGTVKFDEIALAEDDRLKFVFTALPERS